ncbi:MAG: hypothetical protein DI533_03085 [Cereibacter sphaeroides]|uniref:Glucose/Sorbosone dehydrogenase domain-containing protein n=1 Tax=Cereibacter sphaeroides TaxID=1063 RepID=A0A2W5S9C9_CERSP|nr:MAG: hypothetical protein DI533_03085 [Cereibacter sphaeroides]
MSASRLSVLAVSFLCALPVMAQDISTSAGPVSVSPVADGLEEPWAIGFLPDGGFVVTERNGRLLFFAHAEGAEPVAISGLPVVAATGQGGLLDVLVPRDFAQSREIFLSYATTNGGPGTAMGVGRLSEDGSRLENFRQVFVMAPGSTTSRHFGSRMVEAGDGTIFLTIGERGVGMPAQDMQRHEGSVVRLNRDGSSAAGDPFGDGALPELFSKGHRNPQGAALDGQGRLWLVEHGARGGDELNLVEPGRNYGWPVVSYGRNYNGSRIGTGTEAQGMEQPVRYWDPSIAPSGLMIYAGDMFPDWRGDFFTGSLNSDFISRLDPDQGYAEERIQSPETGRVRDVREAPDGSIWFLSVSNGAVYRLAPAG